MHYVLQGGKNHLNNMCSGFGSISFIRLTILPRLQMLGQGTRADLHAQKGKTLISSMNWTWFMPIVKLYPDLFLKSTALFFAWCVMTYKQRVKAAFLDTNLKGKKSFFGKFIFGCFFCSSNDFWQCKSPILHGWEKKPVLVGGKLPCLCPIRMQ